MSNIPDSFTDKTVCIIGLGYVGLTLAVTMAECGFKVMGIEKRKDVVDDLIKGKPHFYEPKLEQVLSQVISNGQLSVHNTIPAGSNADVYIITVGTPLGENGRVRLDMVKEAAEAVAATAKDGILVVMRSTLKLGTTRNIVAPILDKGGINYDLAFCPERTVEGYALKELRMLPQIVGGVTYKATHRAATMFHFLTPTVVRVSDPETAEMIKMVDNCHRDVSFAYSNEIARMCDASGISGVEVIQAGKLGYPRTNLYMPGPVGGPCLSKDPHILAEGMRELGIEPEITITARLLNERQPDEVSDQLFAVMSEIKNNKPPENISLCGLAFKGRPATDDLRGTTAKYIYDAIRTRFPTAKYRGFDAMVSAHEIKDFGLEPCESLEQAFANADLVLILNNHPIFESMPLIELAAKMQKPGIIYDFWNNFDARELALPKGVGYIGLGAKAHSQIPLAEKESVCL